MKNLMQYYWFSILSTLIVLFATFIYGGTGLLFSVFVLTLLEITFSFDNAVVNSKILATMSRLWQTIFLTIGIFVAVFVVRFILPILIVQLSTGLSFTDVFRLAFDDPKAYSRAVEDSAPTILSFGGMFLMTLSLTYFINREQSDHWIKHVEKHMHRAAHVPGLRYIIIFSLFGIIAASVDQSIRSTVFVAGGLGLLLNLGLRIVDEIFERNEMKFDVTGKTGLAALVSLLYLELLDASFSFDGVIGAFAISDNIVVIMAGLGAGAVWVRSITVHLVRTNTLARYQYLEHGAHWAILALGITMIAQLYGAHLPEWFSGSIGIVFIVSALISSHYAQKVSR